MKFSEDCKKYGKKLKGENLNFGGDFRESKILQLDRQIRKIFLIDLMYRTLKLEFVYESYD